MTKTVGGFERNKQTREHSDRIGKEKRRRKPRVFSVMTAYIIMLRCTLGGANIFKGDGNFYGRNRGGVGKYLDEVV